jgi:hypothetical protein
MDRPKPLPERLKDIEETLKKILAILDKEDKARAGVN